MEKELKSRIALVTGSSRGIGRAIAVSLAKAGAEVVVCGSNKERVESARKEVEAVGGKVHAHVLDATKNADVKKLFSDVIKKIGKLDILVNNVGGVQGVKKFPELTDEDWMDAWNLNFMTAVRFSREAIPWLRKSGDGRIINISSVPGKQPGVFNPHYGAAKAAMNHLNKYLANFLAADGVLVNSILPSTVMGGLWEDHVADRAKKLGISIQDAEALMQKEVKEKTPLGKIPAPEDIADAVVFFASDKAKFITGTCIAVDGGVIKSIF